MVVDPHRHVMLCVAQPIIRRFIVLATSNERHYLEYKPSPVSKVASCALRVKRCPEVMYIGTEMRRSYSTPAYAWSASCRVHSPEKAHVPLKELMSTFRVKGLTCRACMFAISSNITGTWGRHAFLLVSGTS